MAPRKKLSWVEQLSEILCTNVVCQWKRVRVSYKDKVKQLIIYLYLKETSPSANEQATGAKVFLDLDLLLNCQHLLMKLINRPQKSFLPNIFLAPLLQNTSGSVQSLLPASKAIQNAGIDENESRFTDMASVLILVLEHWSSLNKQGRGTTSWN